MLRLWKFLKDNILKLGIIFLLVFIPLYPKIPAIGISHVWVYIRLEDFFILLVVLIWLVKLIRLKISSLPRMMSFSISLYWLVGLLSLIFCLIFIGPHLANFFPKVSILSYIRRIEYMILFFVAFSSVKSIKDIKTYIIALIVAISGFSLYAFGQRYYLYFWHDFPKFFEHFSFCFPSFQTGNEQFAKGIALCLPIGARIASTFAGDYDLAAYLVVVIPILITLIFAVKKKLNKIILLILSVVASIVLIFTSSRISFVSFIVSGIMALVFFNRKKWILSFIIASIVLLLFFSSATATRFLQTLRLASVVTNNQGQIVGESESSLPGNLRNKISNNSLVLANTVVQALPEGSGFINLPQTSIPSSTNAAVVKSSLNNLLAQRLGFNNGGIQLSTVSGTFLVRKVLAYDISFTTRFQGEWPKAWKAFTSSPVLGSGYSSITLAADNDFLRALGETGILGLLSFLFILFIFYITVKDGIADVKAPFVKAFILGLLAGIIGLLVNATLIDVFEASKMAESLWILMGIAVAGIFLYRKKPISYREYFKKFISSSGFLICVLFVILLIVFLPSINNFFTADDFTWLRWAASSTVFSIKTYFLNSQGFFYRPLDKTIMFFLYDLFSFEPQGYHLVMLLVHFFVALGVYFLALKIFNKNKVLSFLSSLLFLLLPSQSENVFWISTISTNFSALFMIYALIFFVNFRQKGSKIYYIISLLLSIAALASYEMAVILPLLFVVLDIFLTRQKKNIKAFLCYIPYLFLIPLYLEIRRLSHTVSAGGNYAYSLVHLIPNTVGNFLGYFALFIFGDKALPVYASLRQSLRPDSTLVIIIIIIIIAVILLSGVLFVSREKFAGIRRNKTIQTVVFFLLFSFVALLPFIGLGNISLRYSYFASIGFVFLLVSVLDKLIRVILKKYKYINYVLVALVIIISVGYWGSLNSENSQWNNAGVITENALFYFRYNFESIPSNSNIILINTPLKAGNIWIFPEGMQDGLWFIYRDPTFKFYETSSISSAESLKKGLGTKDKTYIFAFDAKDNINVVY